MFDNYICKQSCDKHIIRSVVRLHGGDGGVEACQALAGATRVVFRMMIGVARLVRMVARLVARIILLLIVALLFHR